MIHLLKNIIVPVLQRHHALATAADFAADPTDKPYTDALKRMQSADQLASELSKRLGEDDPLMIDFYTEWNRISDTHFKDDELLMTLNSP